MTTTEKWIVAGLSPVLVCVIIFCMWWNYETVTALVVHYGQNDRTLAKGLALVLDLVLIMGLVLKLIRNSLWVWLAVLVPMGVIAACGIATGVAAGGIPGAVFFSLTVILLVIVEQCLLDFLPGNSRVSQEVPGTVQEVPVEVQEVPGTVQETPALVQEVPGITQETPGTVQEIPVDDIARVIASRDPLPGWVRVSREFETSESRARRAVKLAKEGGVTNG